MKRFFIIFFCFSIFLYSAQKIEISAKNFKNIGNITTITGNVHVIKGNDILDSDKLKIITDENRKPLSYEATGNVSFSIVTSDGRNLKGNSNSLIYNVAKNEYKLYDNVVIKEVNKSDVVKGNLIVLGSDGNYANIVGDEKSPAHVTFTLENKENAP